MRKSSSLVEHRSSAHQIDANYAMAYAYCYSTLLANRVYTSMVTNGIFYLLSVFATRSSYRPGTGVLNRSRVTAGIVIYLRISICLKSQVAVKSQAWACMIAMSDIFYLLSVRASLACTCV